MKINNIETAIEHVRQHPKLVVAEDYEIVSQKTDLRTSHFNNGDLIGESKNTLYWLQIRVLHRKRLGVASTVFAEDEALTQIVDRAFDLAEHTAVDPWFRFPLWKPEQKKVIENASCLSDPSTLGDCFFKSQYATLSNLPIGLEERYSEQNDSRVILRKMEKATRGFSVRTQKFQFSVVNQSEEGFYRVEDSRGFTSPFKEKGPFLEAVIRKSDRLSRGCVLDRAPTGSYILSGSVVGSLLKSIESLFVGNLALLGRSRASDQLEKRIFSDQVSVIDDGRYLGGEGSQDFDFEGATSEETHIVEKGILRTFIHNASTAARYNRATTANFVMNEPGRPGIGVTNCYLLPSETPPLDLFKQMGTGLYLECLERTEKKVTRDGKLGLLAHGWRVKNGEPYQPFTHLFLVVDPLELFKEITLVGNDLEFWGRFGAPSVFLENMPLSEA